MEFLNFAINIFNTITFIFYLVISIMFLKMIMAKFRNYMSSIVPQLLCQLYFIFFRIFALVYSSHLETVTPGLS